MGPVIKEVVMLEIKEPPSARRSTTLSEAARIRMTAQEGTPLLHSDWVRSLFLHYETDAQALAKFVPYELDLHRGSAYVSLVAFQMRNLRPHLGGAMTAWLSRPVANHGFLNVRTYVKHRGEAGIFFLAEWLPNALSVFIGPRVFGLPYRRGKLNYEHDHEAGALAGMVSAKGAGGDDQLRYRARVETDAPFAPCAADTLDEFLLERYTAFTERGGVRRRFRVWHEPWPQRAVSAAIDDQALIAQTGDWLGHARFIGANYSPGVFDVQLGRPQCINGEHCQRRWP